MKKPSEIKTAKAKKAWFLPSNMAAMTLFGTIYCHSKRRVDEINKTDGIDSQLESHETIHIRQAESTSDSWFVFCLKYVWQWVKNLPLLFVNVSAPYKFISFELEAHRHQDDWNYCVGKCERWKKYGKLNLREKRILAKDYYHNAVKPYFTDFIKNKIDPIIR